jgi:hypothetical protein
VDDRLQIGPGAVAAQVGVLSTGELGIADEVCEALHELVPNRNAREHHGQESTA